MVMVVFSGSGSWFDYDSIQLSAGYSKHHFVQYEVN